MFDERGGIVHDGLSDETVSRLEREMRMPALARLPSPVGLDIGAHSAAEIALSVVAEMRAVLDGRRGGMLRERRDSIHGGADDGAYVSSAEPRLVPRAAA